MSSALSLNWAPLFSAAGLDAAKWPPAQPTWTPPVYSDARAAWTGSLAERPDIPMRIEAAAYRGKPVYFELIGPWTRPERMQPYQPTTGERVALAILSVLLLSVVAGGALLARRNLRLGRGDRRGASRLAAVILATVAVAYSVMHHVPNFGELSLFLEAWSGGLAWSCFLWVLYIALEPYVRRRWPATLVSWSRLLAGGFRDPLVGRDVLAGCLLGAFSTVFDRLAWFVPAWLGFPPAQPQSGPQSGPQLELLGARTMVADLTQILIGAPFFWLAFLFVLVLLRGLLRKEWAAAVAIVILVAVIAVAGIPSDAAGLVTPVIFLSLSVFLLMRFGLLAMLANYVIHSLLTDFPLTTQASAWYAGISLAGILLIATIAFYGFYTSFGGRPILGAAAFED
jgi:serine/threonine-protein kinase